MGIIQKQALSNSIYSYIGAAIGFVTVAIIFAHLLTTEQNGLLSILVSVSGLTGALANMGVNGITARMFPIFRDKDKMHHGYLFYPLVITLIGFLIFTFIFFALKNNIVAWNFEKSKLLTDYIYCLIPLTLFTALYNIFDGYSRVIYLSTAGVFIKEVLQRILVLVFILLYYKSLINFEIFVYGYCLALCFPALAFLFYLFIKKELNLQPNFNFLNTGLKKEMFSVGSFSIITGLSGMLVSSLDKIILNQKLGLAELGIFGIAMYFGSVISIPSRSILRISSSVIADAWQKNDLETIYKVYHKTCINLLIIGAFLFLGIWLNIDTILKILPAEYNSGKWVIFFVAMGYLIDMATGANGIILSTSKYYKYDTYFVVFLVGLTCLTNVVFINLYGITGSAIAFAITLFSFNFFRFIFIYNKFKMQPLDKNNLKVITISILIFLVNKLLPTFENLIVDIFIRSFMIALLFGFSIIKLKVSEDLTRNYQYFKNKFLK